MNAAQESADALGDGSGNGGRTNTEPQHCHKQQIQHDVDNRGDHQVVEGMAAVAHSMEDTDEDIVHYDEDGTGKVPAEVADGLGQHFLWCSHPPEDRRSEAHACGCQHDTGHKSKGDGCMDRFAHRVIVLGTKKPGDDHTGTHGHAVEETDHHPNEASRRTDRSQRIFTYEVANTPGVESIVKLLKHVADEYRKRKKEHPFPDAAFCQGKTLTRHKTSLLSLLI